MHTLSIVETFSVQKVHINQRTKAVSAKHQSQMRTRAMVGLRFVRGDPSGAPILHWNRFGIMITLWRPWFLPFSAYHYLAIVTHAFALPPDLRVFHRIQGLELELRPGPMLPLPQPSHVQIYDRVAALIG